MAEYAYVASQAKLEGFLDKIQDVGVPVKATQSWLTSIGFTSTNDRPILSLMKQIGFIDQSGKPTAAWEQFRHGERSALAAALRDGYGSFYSVYPDAHKRSNSELEAIVKSTAPRLGKEAVGRTISTFRTLIKVADFDADGSANGMVGPTIPTVASANGHVPETEVAVQPAVVARSLGPGLTINVNVQLTLPETTDGSVYEKLFAAMREHLLDGLTDGA